MKDEAGRALIFCGTKGLPYRELRAKGGVDELAEEPSEKDLEAISRIPFNAEELKKSWGVDAFDRDFSSEEALREMLLKPSANIAGILSGYTGPGSKTIVPSEAFVKMDFRLVAGQSPGPVVELIRSHLRKRGFEDIEVVDLHGVEPAKTPVDSPVVNTAIETWQDLGVEEAVVYPTIGGSGPTSLLVADLGIPTIMTGSVANTGSRLHSPNEWVRLDDYFEAINYFARFFERFAL